MNALPQKTPAEGALSPAPEPGLPGAVVTAAPVARKSNFYTALRILPPEQREAMFQVYAFCRAVDDVADEGGPRAMRMHELMLWRRDVDALYDGKPLPMRVMSLAPFVKRFRLQRADFLAVIEGMEMDACADLRAPDWATLDLYCDRVASAVGRLSVRIFGIGEEDGVALAHHLGRALQLTNILRDIDEDAAIGRLYLPREALQAAGITTDEPFAVAADPRLPAACAEVVARAREHFRHAHAIIARAPRETTRSPRVMAAVYGAILDRVERQGFAPPRTRVRTPKARVLWAILRHGLR